MVDVAENLFRMPQPKTPYLASAMQKKVRKFQSHRNLTINFDIRESLEETVQLSVKPIENEINPNIGYCLHDDLLSAKDIAETVSELDQMQDLKQCELAML